MTLDLDALEARASSDPDRVEYSADLRLIAEVRKLREALAFIEGKACAHENLYPNCGFEAIENIAREALEAKDSQI